MGAQTSKFDYFRSSSTYFKIHNNLEQKWYSLSLENSSFVVWLE